MGNTLSQFRSDARRARRPANASINRELAALKRMFSLAVQDGRLSTMPYISTLEEDNARQGFIHHGAFISLRDNLPEYLRDPIAFLLSLRPAARRDEGAGMARCGSRRQGCSSTTRDQQERRRTASTPFGVSCSKSWTERTRSVGRI